MNRKKAFLVLHISKISIINLKTKKSTLFEFALRNNNVFYHYYTFSYFQYIGKKLLTVNYRGYSYRKKYAGKIVYIDDKMNPRKIKAPITQGKFENVSVSTAISNTIFHFFISSCNFLYNVRKQKVKYMLKANETSRNIFDFDEKLKCLSDFNFTKKYYITNLNSGKLKERGRVSKGRLCRNGYKFSKNHRFLLIRGFNKIYSIFSVRNKFQLLKSMQIKLESTLMFFEHSKIFICDSQTKLALFFKNSLFSILEMKSAKGLKKHENRAKAYEYLKKRIGLFDDFLTQKVEESKVSVRDNMSLTDRFFKEENRKLTPEEQKVNELCHNMFELEQKTSKSININKCLDFLEAKVNFYKEYLKNK